MSEEKREPRAGDLWVSNAHKDHIVFLVGVNDSTDRVNALFLNRYNIRQDNDPESNCPGNCSDFNSEDFRYIGRISGLFLALEEELVKKLEAGEL